MIDATVKEIIVIHIAAYAGLYALVGGLGLVLYNKASENASRIAAMEAKLDMLWRKTNGD